MYIIGIDPSSQESNTGFAIYDTTKKKFVTIRSMNFLSAVNEALEFLEAHCEWDVVNGRKRWKNAFCMVENADLDGPVFGAWKSFSGLLRSKWRMPINSVLKILASKYKSDLRHAQNIGMVKIASRVLVKGMEDIGLMTYEIAPSWRHSITNGLKTVGGVKTKDVLHLTMPTKTNAAQFKKLTGYAGRSNEHGRDAATMIYEQSPQKVRMFVQHKLTRSTSLKPEQKRVYLKKLGILK